MTKRYTNISRIKRSNALEEFKGYVSGMVNQDNSLTFDKAFNAVKDIVSGNTSTISSVLSSLTDKELRDLTEIFLGVDGGAYFIKDLYSGEALKSYSPLGLKDAFKNLSESVHIVYENKIEVKNGIVNNPGKAIENLKEQKNISAAISYATVNNEFTFKENEREYGKIASAFEVPDTTLTKQDIPGELDVNKEISDPNRITQPSLGAIVFKDGQFSLSKRGQDEIAVFFNMLSNIEMSKCSPYLYVSVVTKGSEKKISLDKYFGYDREDFSNPIANFVSDKAKDYLSKTKQKLNPSENYQTVGMEIFTSPQTLSNADIRKIPGKEHVLEPISSLLSIQSVNIENAGLGYGLFSSKRARIELVLHDRSRLRDIAPLISVEEFGQTKIVMEYGWYHPEGGANSDNPIGIFLNSLREGGVFVVVKSDFSFNEKSVKISLDLAMSGENEVRRVSAATGLKIQSSIAKPQIENAISEIIKNKDLTTLESIKKLSNIEAPEARKQAELKEVRRISRIAVGEYTNKNSLIDRSDFRDIIKFSGTSGSDRDESQLISVIESAYDLSSNKLDKITSTKKINKSESKVSDDGLNLIRQLSMKLRAFEQNYIDDPFITDTEEALSKFSVAGLSNSSRETTEQNKISSNILSDAIAQMKTSQSNQTIDFSKKYTTLGRVLLSLVGTSMASVGQYDEVQMIFYPMNDRSAGAHVYTTASFPINIKDLIDKFNEEIKKSPNISVARACSIVEKIIRDPQNEAYLLKDEMLKIAMLRNTSKKNVESSLKSISEGKVDANDIITNLKEVLSESDKYIVDTSKNKSLSSTISQAKSGLQQKDFKNISGEDFDNFRTKMIEAYENLRNRKLKFIYSLGDDPEKITDPKFVIPNLSFYYESCSPFVKEERGNNYTIDTSRTILKIHVYDGQSSPNKLEKLLQNMITQGEIPSSITELNEESFKVISRFKSSDVKSFIKKSIPSITLGSAGGQVLGFDIKSSTSGNVSQALLVTSLLKNDNDPQNGMDSSPSFDDIKVIPSTATLNCLGMPILNIGQQIYIDCNTGTTADNIYIVQSVSHDIGPGKFTTSANLTFAGNTSHSSIKEQMENALGKK